MASTNRISNACFRCLRAPLASSSRAVSSRSSSRIASAAFSTSSSNAAASDSAEAPSSTSEERSSSPSSGTGGRFRRRAGPRTLPPFPEWMAGQGQQFRDPKPGMGPNWIGDTPFPLNPAFNPPPPLRQSVKNEIWETHASDPEKWTVHALSEKFSVNKERVHAVLRLKALENEWKLQDKPLQTEFQANMDRLLGAKDRRDAEPEAAEQSFDNAARGAQHEEFSDVEHTSRSRQPKSAIAPALVEAQEMKKNMVSALPSGGPSKETKSAARTIQVSTGSSAKPRATLSIKTVSGDSYEGAGRLQHNLKQATKRRREHRRQAAQRKAASRK